MSTKKTTKSKAKTTPKKDVKATEKKSEAKKVTKEVIDPTKYYTFESNGNSRTMPKGARYSVIGSTLMVFLERNYGKKV